VIDRVLANRALVLITFFLILVLSLVAASRLQIDPNNRVFFGEGHPHFRMLQDLEAQFSSSTSLVFLIRGEDDIFREPDLADAVTWLEERAWSIDRVTSVDSVVRHPYLIASDNDVIVVDTLSYVCTDGKCDIDKAAVMRRPTVTNRLANPELDSFSVIAKVDLQERDPEIVQSIMGDVRQVVDDFREQFPSKTIYLTGGVPMMDAFFTAAQKDSARLLPIVVVVLGLGLYVFLGGLIPTAFLIMLGLSAVIVAMGAASAVGLVINTATATAPLIVFTLVVAAAMHVFLHIVREERLDDSLAVRAAVKVAVNANWKPVVLTALTTAIGLSSMVFVTAPPLRELGLVSAFGVVIGAAMTLLVVPCWFSYLSRLRTSNYLAFVQRGMNRYASWIELAKPNRIVVAATVFFALVLGGLIKVRIDEDFVRYFSADTGFRKDTEEITRYLAGPYQIDLVYDSGQSGGVFGDEAVRDLSDLRGFLASQSKVVSVVSILDVLDEVASAFSGAEISELSDEERAQLFLTYELSLGIGQSSREMVDVGHRNARISVSLSDVSMGGIRKLREAVQLHADEIGIGDRLIVTGEGVPTAFLSSESIREMAAGIVLSVIFSAVLVGLYFGDIRSGATIFVATVVPILAGFGAWGWIDAEIGMAATLVVAITIGVVIDDTIHLTYRYIDGLRNLDLTPWGATAYSVHKAGTAILITSLVLVGGLLVLTMSDFRMNSTFGLCASLVIGLALVYNLVIAPRLLSRIS
tara:strand:+ start:4034 stop:6286 length:2253 start_codon:yes stop_codon:yes gene_type:complete